MSNFFFSIDELLADSDSDWEDADEEKTRKTKKSSGKGGKAALDKGRRKKGAAWIKEGTAEDGEEDIVDFLDPSVKQKVLGE